jgi:hypothetical protein
LLPHEPDTLLDAFEDRLARLGWHERGLNHVQGDDHRNERNAVEGEVPGCAELDQRYAAQRRADHPRQVELDGIERNRVLQVFLGNQGRNQGRIRGPAEGLRDADDEGQTQDVPHMHGTGEYQRGQQERAGHLDVLRHHQDPTAIVTIGKNSAYKRQQDDRNLPKELVQPQIEGGFPGK